MLKILCELGDLCEGSSTLLEKQVPERKDRRIRTIHSAARPVARAAGHLQYLLYPGDGDEELLAAHAHKERL